MDFTPNYTTHNLLTIDSKTSSMVPEASMILMPKSLAILGQALLTFCWKSSGFASKVSGTGVDLVPAYNKLTVQDLIYNNQNSGNTGAGVEVVLTTGKISTNLCTEGAQLEFAARLNTANQGGNVAKIFNIELTCKTDATTTKVPCTVYYYP